MQPENIKENPEIQQTIELFRSLKKRFLEATTREEAETTLEEIERVTTNSLIDTQGDSQIMEALENEFISPILASIKNPASIHGYIRSVIENVATNLAKKLTKRE